MYRKAFTLAEVLIVLGIIGIVASMTIPTLMTKIQDMEFKTAAKKAYSVTSDAIKRMNYENGTTTSDYNSCQTLKPALAKYFKVIKDCGTDDNGCLTRTEISEKYKNLSGALNIIPNWFDDGQFITNDGMFYMFENCNGLQIVTVDVNGYEKQPNTFGRDVFMFQIISNSLLPVGADRTYMTAKDYCNKANNIPNQGMGCMYYVMQGINY